MAYGNELTRDEDIQGDSLSLNERVKLNRELDVITPDCDNCTYKLDLEWLKKRMMMKNSDASKRWRNQAFYWKRLYHRGLENEKVHSFNENEKR